MLFLFFYWQLSFEQQGRVIFPWMQSWRKANKYLGNLLPWTPILVVWIKRVVPDRGSRILLLESNNKDILIEGKTCFYRHYFHNGVILTKNRLYDMTITESFRAMKEQGLTNSKCLVWTGLRQSVPSKWPVNIQNFKNTVIGLENYYYHLKTSIIIW